MRNLWFCPPTKANFSFFPTCRLFKIILISPKWIKTRLTFPQLLSIICSSVPNCLSKSKQVRGKWENREQVSAKTYLLTNTGKKHQHQFQRQFLFIHLTEQDYHNRITSVGWDFCLFFLVTTRINPVANYLLMALVRTRLASTLSWMYKAEDQGSSLSPLSPEQL